MCACICRKIYAEDDVGFGVEGLAVFLFEETNGDHKDQPIEFGNL